MRTRADTTGAKTARKSATKKRVFHGYRLLPYDPVLDEFRSAWKASPRVKKSMVSLQSDVSVSCLTNWLNGKTRNPSNIRIEFAMRAMGFERPKWRRRSH